MNAVTQILPSHQWESFNRARKFFTVYLMLQIILSDGMTVDPEKVQARDHQQSESIMVFPTENLTLTDFRPWKETICLLTSPTLRLSPRLGKFR